MLSSSFSWDVEREEQAVEIGQVFDVRRAKQIIVEKPRPVEPIDLSVYRAFFEQELEDVRLRTDVDWNSVDPDLPVIFGSERGKKFPIDGRHRLTKALREGRTSCLAVSLTDEETRAIQLLPARHTLD